MDTNLQVVLGLAVAAFLVLTFSRARVKVPAAPTYCLQAAAADDYPAYATAETLEDHKQENRGEPGPGKTSGLELTDEVLEDLVTARPPLKGFQNKTGILPPEKWMLEFAKQRAENLKSFKAEALNETVNFLQQPSRKFSGCIVYVNHAYKFFWIRTLKTGSSSVVEGIGKICRDSVNPGKNCSTTFPWGKIPSKPGDAERWWKEYFVFSTVRNPYSRFASAFFYLNPAHACSNQTLGDACKDPFLRGLDRSSSSECKLDEFYFRHIREQTPCLTTQKGGLAVDFVAQTESLTEDFEQILKEINKRRGVGVPPMQSNLGKFRKASSVKSTNATYADPFKQYPHCLKYLDTLLAKEFVDLGYFSGQ